MTVSLLFETLSILYDIATPATRLPAMTLVENFAIDPEVKGMGAKLIVVFPIKEFWEDQNAMNEKQSKSSLQSGWDVV